MAYPKMTVVGVQYAGAMRFEVRLQPTDPTGSLGLVTVDILVDLDDLQNLAYKACRNTSRRAKGGPCSARVRRKVRGA